MANWHIPKGLRTVDIEGYPLAYSDQGRGAPVVLVHGSLNDCRSWSAQVEALSPSHRVLSLSLRHYYPEPWDGVGGDFSLQRHAADVAAFIRALGLSGAHLVGHSRGGSVAYMVARDAPELAGSLTLAEPRGLEDLLAPEDVAGDGSRSNAGIFEALHADLLKGDKARAVEAFVDAFNGPGSWQALTKLQRTILLDNINTAVDSGELPGMRCEDIAGFGFPILLIRGEKSLSRYALGLEAMRRCNSSIAPVVVIPNAPHGMHRANPAAFNAAVLAFLASVGRTR
ncbi:alpha/beta hydrolase [Microbaculum marinum]|uniref:Alpha/beta hydrolase n=1 Tax=Microbaculum marinum TaxID=1764581 RepID=A0AAW9RRF6_9HYPH